jgi:hypothetical protein
MLKIRQDIAPTPPKPFSDESVDLLFMRLRKQFGLSQPDIDPAKWSEFARKSGAKPVEF